MKTHVIISEIFNYYFALLVWLEDKKVTVKYFTMNTDGNGLESLDNQYTQDERDILRELSDKAGDYCKANDLILWSY